MAYVEVDLDDFDDQELIDELNYRGYAVVGDNTEQDIRDGDMDNAVFYFKIGNIEETLYQIERAYPELHGLIKAVKKKDWKADTQPDLPENAECHFGDPDVRCKDCACWKTQQET